MAERKRKKRRTQPGCISALVYLPAFVLILLISDPVFALDKAGIACDKLLHLLEGSFGALVATAAGIGAILACAMGGFRAAWAVLIVSVGAFILRSYISLFHGTCP